MRVLADPDGPLDETVPANRPVTLRDLLTFTFGTGIVPAEPGTVPIADALNALRSEAPDQGPASSWSRRRRSGFAGSARFRWSTSRASGGCTTPPPT